MCDNSRKACKLAEKAAEETKAEPSARDAEQSNPNQQIPGDDFLTGAASQKVHNNAQKPSVGRSLMQP
eukprot:SAG31_NODE_26881_length_435_cov_0.511905_1_plen_67_part_10